MPIELSRAEQDLETESPRVGGMTLNVAVGSFLTTVAFLIGARPISDNSFFTHLATGHLILSDGSVPTADPYSLTAAGEPWVVQSWLVSLVYAALDSTVGLFGIRAFHGILAALTVWTIWKLSDRSNSLLVRLGCTSLVIIVGASLWSPRPLLVGLLGFTLVLAALDRRIPVWTLLPVMWVWANSHGSFPLAGVLTGTFMVGTLLDQRTSNLPGPWWRSHETTTFLWVCAGTALAGLNPLGIKLLTFPVHLLSRREALENVLEWKPLTLVTPWGIVMVPLLIGLAVAAARGARWKLLVPALVFTASAFLAVRNINVAVILLAVGIAPWIPTDFGTLKGTETGRLPRVMSATAAGLFAVILISLTAGGLELGDYPVEDVKALAAEGRVANPDQPIITTEIVGNYLTAAYGDEAAVFVDDRFDMYPLEIIQDYEELLFGGDYRTILDKYDAQTVLWFSGSGLEFWLRESPEWVVQDGVEPGEDLNKQWIIARRVTPSPAVLASAP